MRPDKTPETARRPAKSGSTLYVSSWVAIGIGSLAYLATISYAPQTLGSAGLFGAQADGFAVADTRPSPQQSAVDTGRETMILRGWVRDLQGELTSTKTELQTQRERADMLASELAAARDEARAVDTSERQAPAASSVVTGSIPVKTVTVPVTPQPAAAKPPSKAVVTAKPKAAPAAVPQKTAVRTPPPPPPVKFSAPVVKPSGPPAAVEIASADTLDGLRSSWTILSATNSRVLGRLQPRYVIRADGSAAPFSLLAGPFADTAQAQRACAQLRSRRVNCRVSTFAGNAM